MPGAGVAVHAMSTSVVLSAHVTVAVTATGWPAGTRAAAPRSVMTQLGCGGGGVVVGTGGVTVREKGAAVGPWVGAAVAVGAPVVVGAAVVLGATVVRFVAGAGVVVSGGSCSVGVAVMSAGTLLTVPVAVGGCAVSTVGDGVRGASSDNDVDRVGPLRDHDGVAVSSERDRDRVAVRVRGGRCDAVRVSVRGGSKLTVRVGSSVAVTVCVGGTGIVTVTVAVRVGGTVCVDDRVTDRRMAVVAVALIVRVAGTVAVAVTVRVNNATGVGDGVRDSCRAAVAVLVTVLVRGTTMLCVSVADGVMGAATVDVMVRVVLD